MGRFSTLAAVGGLLATASALPTGNVETRQEPTNMATVDDFADIPIKKEIEWVPCFENFTCTNLEVPLDYANTSAGTTNIAFLKATGGDGTGPDILINNGGPGQLGTSFAYGGAAGIFTTLGIEGENFNIIGFDPRGVGNSGPNATCFPSTAEDHSRDLQSFARGGGLNGPLQEVYASQKALGEHCSLVNADTDVSYIGTSAVAQDLKYFIELQALSNGKSAAEAKLWYYGISYGTVIGHTFAALYPNSIERMILDGNVYSEQYYNGLITNQPDNADEAILSFFEYCAEAGPEICLFAGIDTYGKSLTTAEQLEERYNNLLKKLQEEPLISLSGPVPSIITHTTIANSLFSASYNAIIEFPLMAKVLAELDFGNSTTYENMGSSPPSEKLTPEDSNPLYSSQEGLMLITCVDISGRLPIKNFDDYLSVYNELSSFSIYGGRGLALTNAAQCAGFDVPQPDSQVFPGFTHTTTSKPILFVNFLRDPTTPASSADAMSKYFPGSVVLKQDATGHGMNTSPSNCTLGHVQAYLSDATLPEPGTICESDIKPFATSRNKP